MPWQSEMDRLRAELFVGRESEQETFRRLLAAPGAPDSGSPSSGVQPAHPPVALLVSGPPGIGKTALLRHMAACARTSGHATAWLDASAVDGPNALDTALATLTATPGGASGSATGDGEARVAVWFIDALVPGLVVPLFERVFPRLPADVCLVAATTEAPPAWRADPVVRRLVQALPLGPLGKEDSRALLRTRGVDDAAHAPILAFAYGHPLALALAADVAVQVPNEAFEPLAAPALIGALVSRFAAGIDSDDARDALTAAALVRTLDEPLLAALLGRDDARERFEWLSQLAITERLGLGLGLHPLVQDVLTQDARWRNPVRFDDLHVRARGAYAARLIRAAEADFAPLLADYLFLLRDNPIVRPFFELLVRPLRTDAPRRWRTRAATTADIDRLVALTEAHEGAASAQWARLWLTRDPSTARVYEDHGPDLAASAPALVGFLMTLRLAPGADTHGDPAVEAALRVAGGVAPLRSHEHATLFRFWMASETYQNVSPVQALIFVETVRHYLATPGLAVSLLPFADVGLWQLVMAVAGLDRMTDADFEIGGRVYGVFGHDWRRVPPDAWLGRIARFGLDPAPPAPTTQARRVLSRKAFGDAVDEALRCARRPDQLARTVLAETRLVGDRRDTGEALVAVIREAIERMAAVPRTRPLALALDASFFSSIATQERVAEHLGLPFSTYRRHRRRATEALADALWIVETESAAGGERTGGATNT